MTYSRSVARSCDASRSQGRGLQAAFLRRYRRLQPARRRVRCAADDRQALEQLCRYITRPALSNERVQTNAAGQVVLKLKTPWRDGTTYLVWSRLVCLCRGWRR